MRLYTIAALVLVAFQAVGVLAVATVTPDAVPHCGMNCITSLTLDSTCMLGNLTCMCANVQLNEQISICLHQNCTVRESLLVQRYSKQQCKAPSRDRTALVWVIGVVFLGLGLMAFGLRVIARLFLVSQTWGADDWALLVAVGMMIAINTISIPISDIALGKDIWTVEPDDITKFLYLFFWDELLYLGALPITKISILLFYLRVFPGRGTRIACWILIGFNLAFFIVWEVISIFQCKPISGAWKAWDGEFEAKCNNINIQGWSAAGVTIVLDLATLIVPLPELWKLNLSFAKRAQALLMFSVGIFVTIVSVVRLQSLATYATTQNVTQDYVEVGYWSTIEVPVGIICACMPAIRSLLVRAFPTVFATTRAASDYANISSTQSKTMTSTMKDSSRTSTYGGAAVSSEWPKYQQGEPQVELTDMNHSGPIRPMRPARPERPERPERIEPETFETFERVEAPGRPVRPASPVHYGQYGSRGRGPYDDEDYFNHGNLGTRVHHVHPISRGNSRNYNYSHPNVRRQPSRKNKSYFEDV